MKCAYIVGRYKAAGNLMGTFKENVPKGNFDQSYCEAASSKRRKYFDAKGNPVIVEVDVPGETNGTSSIVSSHAHGHNTNHLKSKENN